MKNILLLLCISSFCFGMENIDTVLLPCKERKKFWYVDYVVSVIIGIDENDKPITSPYCHLGQRVNKAIEHLNKCSFEDGKPNNLVIPLLRIYEGSKLPENVWYKKTNEEIINNLVKLGAEQGDWNCTEAMQKIKEKTGIE